jgi:hypothetical protein
VSDPIWAEPFTPAEQSAQLRYHEAAHKMQTGVRLLLGAGQDVGVSAKHVRVGINSAMVEHSALALILLRNKVISREDYLEALAEAMESEAASYETRVQKIFPGVRLA